MIYFQLITLSLPAPLLYRDRGIRLGENETFKSLNGLIATTYFISPLHSLLKKPSCVQFSPSIHHREKKFRITDQKIPLFLSLPSQIQIRHVLKVMY
jgi:hypothetical protein